MVAPIVQQYEYKGKKASICRSCDEFFHPHLIIDVAANFRSTSNQNQVFIASRSKRYVMRRAEAQKSDI
jgi:hypothetical protein